MLIAALSDIHGRTPNIKTIAGDLARADLVTISGDITHFGNDRSAQWILEDIRDINKNMLAVSGNCDKPEVDGYLKISGMGVHLDLIEKSGVTFTGLNGSLPCPGTTPNEYSEEEYAAALDLLSTRVDPNQPLVLISHQPPAGKTVASLSSGQNIGSSSVRNFIQKTAPLVCLCGHIHEARGTEKIGPTTVVNSGSLGLSGYYAMVDLDPDSREVSVEMKNI